MRARLTYLLHELRGSFWFLPTLMTCAAGALSVVTLALDRDPQPVVLRLLPWSNGLGLANARLIMSTIAGSIMTAASLVFSLTLVSLTLASGQLGPRLLSLFMRDRMTQTVLGTFISTFVFALLVLANLGDAPGAGVVPRVSIFVALVLTLSSFGLLIAFIHHLARSMHADVVVAQMADALNTQVSRLCEGRDEAAHPLEGSAAEWDAGQPIRSVVGGYVQTIDGDALVQVARAHDTALRLRHRAGHFVGRGEPLALIRPGGPAAEALASEVCGAVVFGQKRTNAEDPEFAFQAIVEVGLRALSPGINDPHTALTCLDWLGEGLRRVLTGPLPDPILRDEEGEVRVVAVPLTAEGFFNTAFNEIRQAAEGNVAVLVRLAETLGRLAEVASTTEHRRLIRHHAEMLARACDRSVVERFDQRDVKLRLEALESALSG